MAGPMPLKPHSLWELGYRMTTAEIEVESLSVPGLSHTLVWQDLDQAPNFPVLCSYLNYWKICNSGKFASVQVATYDGVTPDDLHHLHISLEVH